MYLTEENFGVRNGVECFSAIAGISGAHLPARLPSALFAECGDGDEDENICQDSCFCNIYDLIGAVADAAREVAAAHAHNNLGHPTPRGIGVEILPSGNLRLVWVSDTHTTSILFRRDTGAKWGYLSDTVLVSVEAAEGFSHRAQLLEQWAEKKGLKLGYKMAGQRF